MSEITKVTRRLRNNQTDAEKELWRYLRYTKPGVKFRRQFPVFYVKDNTKSFFVADFICLEKKLIIEVDGKIHEKQKESDESRDLILKNLGYNVIRIKNEDILSNNGLAIEIINRYI